MGWVKSGAKWERFLKKWTRTDGDDGAKKDSGELCLLSAKRAYFSFINIRLK